MAKRMILKGVGTFMAKRVGGSGEEIVTLGTLQDLKIDLSTEIEDIFGGDGMFAIDTLVKSKSIEVTATDAKFDLNAISLMLGSTVTEGVSSYLWVLNEGKTMVGMGASAKAEKFSYTCAAAQVAGKVTFTVDGQSLETASLLATATDDEVASAVKDAIDHFTNPQTGTSYYTTTILTNVVTATARLTGPRTIGTDGVDTDTPANVLADYLRIDTGASSYAESTAALVYNSTIYTTDPDFTVKTKLDNVNLIREYPAGSSSAWTSTEYEAIGVGGFVYNDTTGKIYTRGDHGGKDLVINYKRQETVDMAVLLADEVPFPVSVIHHGSFQQKDGTFQGVETELFACQAKGTFSINAQRAAASASSVTLSIVDPERADGRIGTIKRYSSATKV